LNGERFNEFIEFYGVNPENLKLGELQEEMLRDSILSASIFALATILSITATVFNFTGWTKNKRKNCLIAGIPYVLSLNFPSAILCFVEYANMAKPVKSKVTLISAFLGISAALPWLAMAIFFPRMGDNDDKVMFIVALVFLIITLVGSIINFIAWKTEKRALVLTSAIVYTLGVTSIVSAIICYISFAMRKKTA
jgi:hypothetical protein